MVPVYNEVESLGGLWDALRHALVDRDFEAIFVDDGSTDGSRELLARLASEDPRLRLLKFRRNSGQTAAMAAGFHAARAEVVVTMDADLQNDPADIPRMIDELERGHDIVCGWRRYRKDTFVTRLLPSKIANLVISRITRVPIHDTGCSLKVYRGWVVRSLHLYSDMHRFIAALAVGVGARVSELPVRHHARRFGESKYGLGRTFKVVIDLIVIKMLIQSAAHPIRFFGLLSLPLFLTTFLLVVFGLFRFRDFTPILVETYDLTYMTSAAVTAILAMNVFLLGFLAELQLEATRFFGDRTSMTAREAVR